MLTAKRIGEHSCVGNEFLGKSTSVGRPHHYLGGAERNRRAHRLEAMTSERVNGYFVMISPHVERGRFGGDLALPEVGW